tara:strand:- start:1013 stop:1153 length:141 start_codon:yes stop_codon:yes gene_type:complete
MSSDPKIKKDVEQDPLDILRAQIENMSPKESMLWSDDSIIKEKNES